MKIRLTELRLGFLLAAGVGVASGYNPGPARVAELVDALDLESSGATREGSSPSFRMIPRETLKNP